METKFTYEFKTYPISDEVAKEKYKILLVKKRNDDDNYKQLVSRFFEIVSEYNAVETQYFFDYHYKNCQGDKKVLLNEIKAILFENDKSPTMIKWMVSGKERLIKSWISDKSAELRNSGQQEFDATDNPEQLKVRHKILTLYYLGVFDYLKNKYPQLKNDSATKLSELISPIIEGKKETIRKEMSYLGTNKERDPSTNVAIRMVKSLFDKVGIPFGKLENSD